MTWSISLAIAEAGNLKLALSVVKCWNPIFFPYTYTYTFSHYRDTKTAKTLLAMLS